MKRILVTGGQGFIGAHCIRPLIEQGYDVHASTRSRGRSADGYVCHQVDLMDGPAIEGLMAQLRPTHLLHLAWETTPGQFWTSPANVDWVKASAKLFETFVRYGGRRFVGTGSCAEYDWTYERLDETTTPCRAASPYGQAKNATRELLAEMARSKGISFAWGRIFFLYGPGEKRGRLVSDVISNLLAGTTIDTSTGAQVRDYMHVADVASGFVALMDSQAVGAVNIASGEPRPIKDILLMIGEKIGRSDLIRFGSRPSPAGDPLRLEASVTRLFDEIGFRPQLSLARGIDDTVNWWRGQLAAHPG